MAEGIRPLIAGNWKMNGLRLGANREVRKLVTRLARYPKAECEVLICPPATLLAPLREIVKGSRIAIGGQNCHANKAGAHTGDVSAPMLKDLGCAYVIVGHSERRADYKESNKMVRAKTEAAHNSGLRAIICVGETAADRKLGKTLEVVGKQLTASLPGNCVSRNTVIAYEPVWAIGTGLTPTTDDVSEVHDFMRARLKRRFRDQGVKMRLLYGGSVKGANAPELLSVQNVNGALVGGASLTITDFWPIVQSCI